MKYIIIESRLNNIVTKWLDVNYGNFVSFINFLCESLYDF